MKGIDKKALTLQGHSCVDVISRKNAEMLNSLRKY